MPIFPFVSLFCSSLQHFLRILKNIETKRNIDTAWVNPGIRWYPDTLRIPTYMYLKENKKISPKSIVLCRVKKFEIWEFIFVKGFIPSTQTPPHSQWFRQQNDTYRHSSSAFIADLSTEIIHWATCKRVSL